MKIHYYGLTTRSHSSVQQGSDLVAVMKIYTDEKSSFKGLCHDDFVALGQYFAKIVT